MYAIYIRDSMPANNTVTKYIQDIYQYLGDKYCFLSGAFVIEDTNQNLFNLLNSNPKTHLFESLGSHLLYNQHKLKPKDAEYYLYETKLGKTIQISCKCEDNTIDSREFRSIKWYKFSENNKHFIYLKVESAPTISLQHGYEAFKTYALRKSTKSCREPRREDCKKQCLYVSDKSPNYDKIIFNTSDEREITDTYARKGDEMFIPNDVNEYILQNIDTSDPLFAYNDNNTITGLHGYKRKMQRHNAQPNIDIEPTTEPELPPPAPEDVQPSPVSEDIEPSPVSEAQPLPEPASEPNTGGKRKSRTLKKHKRSTRSKKYKQNKKSTKSKKSKKTKTVKH